MKLSNTVEKTEIGGATDQGEFRIRSSAKAFSILSSGLYSNKFHAIIRELSCNAIDSHVESGQPDRPIEVHLPTQMEPYLFIRDHGIGLDHEGVMSVYTTYFESTKTDSNDYIGALGLGSKSPFSYTDNFTVTAIKNNVKRLYGCHINDNGIPAIIKMGDDVITDEHNGVTVQIAIHDRDFYSFYSAAEEIYKWFTVMPKFVGAHTPCISNYKDKVVNFWDLDDGTQTHLLSGGCSYAVQGNIAYPLELDNCLPDNLLDELGSIPFVMHFNIGELDIAASREKLQYVKLTNDSIVAKYIKTRDQIVKTGQQEFNSHKTPLEKINYFNSVLQNKTNRRKDADQLHLVGARVAAEKWLSSNPKYCFYSDVVNNNINFGDDYIGVRLDQKKLKKLCTKHEITEFMYYHPELKNSNSYTRQTSDYKAVRDKHPLDTLADRDTFVDGCAKMTIVIDDVSRGGKTRIRDYVIREADNNKRCIYMVFTTADEKFIASVKRMVKNVGVVLSSSMPAPERVSTTATQKPNYYSVSKNSSNNRYSFFGKIDTTPIAKNEDGDYINGNYYYVQMIGRSDVMLFGKILEADEFARIVGRIRNAFELRYDFYEQIIGYRDEDTKLVGGNISTLEQLILHNLRDFDTHVDAIKAQRMQQDKFGLVSKFVSNSSATDEFRVYRDLLGDDHVIVQQFPNPINNNIPHKVITNYKEVYTICRQLGLHDNKFMKTYETADDDLTQANAQIAKYTLVKHMQTFSSWQDFEKIRKPMITELCKYIKVVDGETVDTQQD